MLHRLRVHAQLATGQGASPVAGGGSTTRLRAGTYAGRAHAESSGRGDAPCRIQPQFGAVTRSGALFERLAAGLALTMLAAAVVLLLAGTVRNWVSVVLALAGLLAATMGGWYTVSRHRTVRWLGLAFLVGSVVLFAWGLLTADLRPVRVILTPLFAAASVGCARLALRRSRRASRNEAQDVPRPAHRS
jgi:hypothetical protein